MTFSLKHIDIQTKIIIVLLSVILPTFLGISLFQYQITRPILEEEWRQIGLSTAELIATKVVSQRWLTRADATAVIENEIQSQLYLQPSVTRIDVIAREENDPLKGKLIASNVEDETAQLTGISLVEASETEFFREEDSPFWRVRVPILTLAKTKSARKVLGMVQVEVSLKSVSRLMQALSRIIVIGAGTSVMILVVLLSYFLRKTVANERRLRIAESKNEALTSQLDETQRQLMNSEKLAVMGQLTARVAHEIGTPLNAISGHLELLQEDLADVSLPNLHPGRKAPGERIQILSGEVHRIETIVKDLLHTTSKPTSENQLVDPNAIVEKTIELLKPRLDAMRVELVKELNRDLPPLLATPLDFEQVLLNLINNSLDSIKQKKLHEPEEVMRITIVSSGKKEKGKNWVVLSVRDTGEGIPKDHLRNVLKPFFTTKGPGGGTGLGLPICEGIAKKYGGRLHIESREGAWTEVTLEVPYRENA